MSTATLDNIQPLDVGKKRTILILGGYGNAGNDIATLLLKATTNVDVVLAGRNLVKAKAAASMLNALFDHERCTAVQMDTSQPLMFSGIDMVVVASPNLTNENYVAEAALRARIDYLDIQYSTEKMTMLRAMESEIKTAGCCFITDAGNYPGMPAALVRYAANGLDKLETADVACFAAVDWNGLDIGVDTMAELVAVFMDLKASVYTSGEWKETSWMNVKAFDFEEFGKQQCVSMDLEEMHDITKLYPDLVEMGFYMGGFNWFVNFFLTPFIMLVLWACPTHGVERAMGRLMLWGVKISSQPPYGSAFKTEVNGTKEGRNVAMSVTVNHKDAYWLTAAPVVACLLQYLDGSIKKPGLWLQGSCVEPERFVKDIERFGVDVKTETVTSDLK